MSELMTPELERLLGPEEELVGYLRANPFAVKYASVRKNLTEPARFRPRPEVYPMMGNSILLQALARAFLSLTGLVEVETWPEL